MHIKTWQIFVFSLIPLALVFAGVIIGSMHGTDSDLEQFTTPPAQPSSSTPTRSYSAPSATGPMFLVALTPGFDLSAPAPLA